MLAARAPAKVNLTLHVLGRRNDGYHALESLVAFAGCGDALCLAPGKDFVLHVDGPMASAAGVDNDNLVLKAARAFAAIFPGARRGTFHLTKKLPVAAGLGGGSSDAAAALRLLARENDIAFDHPDLIVAARTIGADVPVCLDPRPRIMAGAGERLSSPLILPPLFAVLVNPGVPVATADVFRELGLEPGQDRAVPPHPEIASDMDRDALIHALGAGRNDLEEPALRLAPAIGQALAALRAIPGCRLALMSGSGATVFGLFDDCHAAARAARMLRADQSSWWIRPTILR